MGLITISRGSYSKGKEIAEKLSKELEYECTSRDILLEASDYFDIPELKLVRAIHDAPSLLDRFKYGREKFIAYFNKSFLEHMQRDNVVYHGLAGHFLLQDIPNTLKVRIIANCDDRVKEEMKRENISEKEARYILAKDDQERRNWSLHLYGIDTNDPSLYDILIHIDNLSVDDAVDILLDTARRPCFQSTKESMEVLRQRYIAATVRAALIENYPSIQVKCKDNIATVSIDTALSLSDKIKAEVEKVAATIDEVRDVRINLTPTDMD